MGSTLAPDRIEPLEHVVEAVLALCDCDEGVTGLHSVSLDLLAERGLEARALDGGPLGGG